MPDRLCALKQWGRPAQISTNLSRAPRRARDTQESGIPVGPSAFQRLPSPVAHRPWLAAAMQARSAGRLSREASAPATWTPGTGVQVWPPSVLVCTRLTPTIQSRCPSGLMAKRWGVSSSSRPVLCPCGSASAFRPSDAGVRCLVNVDKVVVHPGVLRAQQPPLAGISPHQRAAAEGARVTMPAPGAAGVDGGE